MSDKNAKSSKKSEEEAASYDNANPGGNYLAQDESEIPGGFDGGMGGVGDQKWDGRNGFFAKLLEIQLEEYEARESELERNISSLESQRKRCKSSREKTEKMLQGLRPDVTEEVVEEN